MNQYNPCCDFFLRTALRLSCKITLHILWRQSNNLVHEVRQCKTIVRCLFREGSFLRIVWSMICIWSAKNIIHYTTEANMLFLLETNCSSCKVFSIFIAFFYVLVDTVVFVWPTFAIALGLHTWLFIDEISQRSYWKESPGLYTPTDPLVTHLGNCWHLCIEYEWKQMLEIWSTVYGMMLCHLFLGSWGLWTF